MKGGYKHLLSVVIKNKEILAAILPIYALIYALFMQKGTKIPEGVSQFLHKLRIFYE